MGLNLLDRIQAKIELFRLEQRYTRRRNRRSTFVSNAVYVDGEYIYNSPNTTGSSANTSRTNNSSRTAPPPPPPTQSQTTDDLPTPLPSSSVEQTKAQKRLNRWSSMPGFGGSMSKATSPARAHTQQPESPTSSEWTTQGRSSFGARR
ncbi:hypothetical protein B0T17DRAFT_512167 [Bombardia bombarda]|uniref:Uncharacterized protein n=1 Tax=Bombardia bombarda TaxID=252184 RepID=A0AA39TMN4_9PEZI|nr:hypothetical protein B0T17DRAFT_512167 [Bombardia bombarda]